jgi:hypothetical protein
VQFSAGGSSLLVLAWEDQREWFYMKTNRNDFPVSADSDRQGSSRKLRDRMKARITDRLLHGLELHGGTPRLNGIRFRWVSVLHFSGFFSYIERSVRKKSDWAGKIWMKLGGLLNGKEYGLLAHGRYR